MPENLFTPALDCLKHALEAALPARCLGCKEYAGGPHWLCDACTLLIDYNPAPCLLCGMPGHPLGRCGTCAPKVGALSRCHALLLYQGLIRDLIQDWKFNGGVELTQWLVNCSYDANPGRHRLGDQVDAITPVPMHWVKKLRRGYNQAELLALALEKRINQTTGVRIPVRSSLTTHFRRPDQHGLSRAVRAVNASGAYRVRGVVANQRILLVDDVMTTGATANSAAQALLAAGAKEVQVWCLARAP